MEGKLGGGVYTESKVIKREETGREKGENLSRLKKEYE